MTQIRLKSIYGICIVKGKPPPGQNLSSSPKMALERAASRWFGGEKSQSKPRVTSGLIVYNMFRYYDPELGRYITSDPLGIMEASIHIPM